MRYYVIPSIANLNKYLDLSKKYNLGFEYNDFFNTAILDNPKLKNSIIDSYKALNRKNDTLHGVFFDITLDSSDSLIAEISLKRVRSSLDIAKSLGCKGVIFHTNYITWMKTKSYKDNWVNVHKRIYEELAKEYDIEIYIENMFDLDPYLLKELMDKIEDKRIGVCLDVAHASISNIDIGIWFNMLGKYIKHIHINDNDKIVDSHLELGKGIIDYKEIYKYIKELNNDISILIEINDYDKTLNSIKYIEDGGFDVIK